MAAAARPVTAAAPRLKVCCIASAEEARTAIACGASALGLVSEMPSGPGVIDEDTIAGIAAQVPPPIATFLLTCATRAEDIVAQQRRCGTNTLQLCDYVEPSTYSRIRRELPGISIVQVVHVTGPEAVERARAVSPHVNAILLDSGNTALAVKELGGTGRTHDWATSRRIRDAVAVPVFLAGGLTPANVRSAIAQVDPFGLDLCTGVRSNGRLDASKLRAFVQAMGPVLPERMGA